MCCTAFLSADADVNAFCVVEIAERKNNIDKGTKTPLHFSCESGSLEISDALIQRDASLVQMTNTHFAIRGSANILFPIN